MIENLNLTDTEKEILITLFKMGKTLITRDNFVELNGFTIDRNDLFYLAEKLGIDGNVYDY